MSEYRAGEWQADHRRKAVAKIARATGVDSISAFDDHDLGLASAELLEAALEALGEDFDPTWRLDDGSGSYEQLSGRLLARCASYDPNHGDGVAPSANDLWRIYDSIETAVDNERCPGCGDTADSVARLGDSSAVVRPCGCEFNPRPDVIDWLAVVVNSV